MNRITLLAAVVLAALATALPAFADHGAPIRGTVTVLSASSVSVKDAHRTVTCDVKASSPSLAGYAVGDQVQAQCRGRGRHLVLAKIRHFSAPAAGSASNEAEPVKFGGTVTALSSDSITLHDGDRDLTCAINDTSPSTSALQVGDHAKIVCQNGVLVSLPPATSGGGQPSGPAVTTAAGTVTAVSATSLTIHNVEHGDATCSVSSTSPSLAEVHVGDLVKVACTAGVLSALARSTATGPPPPPPPPPSSDPAPATGTGTTVGGTLSALSSTSLTVHNDEHGDVTCSVTAASPHLGDYHLGDHVKMTCAAGVLTLIARL